MYIYGDNGIKIPLPSGGGVEDVTINGTSIVDETTGVASIPVASDSDYGVIPKYNTSSFIIDSSGTFRLNPCGNLSITNRATQNVYAAITPSNLDHAVKAALTDGVGPAYTSEEQAAARTRLGIDYPVKAATLNNGSQTSVLDSDGALRFDSTGFNSNGTYLYMKDPTESNIKAGGGSHVPLTTLRVKETAFYGLALAAGDETQKTSTNELGTYTDEAKTAIKSMIGINYPVKGIKVNNVDVVGSDGVANITVGQLGGVDDVQIAHNSIVDQYGVAQIPYATYSNLGMVRLLNSEAASGLYVNVYSGDLSISPATLSMIQAAPPDSDVKSPIIPANQHQAVFYGLAKAAGDTYQGGSGYPVGSYIPPAKTAIQEMIGLKIVTQAQYDAIVGADSDGNIYFITED